MKKWFEAKHLKEFGLGMKIEYKTVLESYHSFFQKIDIYDTMAFGKMIVNDNTIMRTGFDKSAYHEMISHVPLNVHPNPEKVLIIGGGDGGTINEVLKHDDVKIANLCERDIDMVRICKKHFPEINKGFDDNRGKVFIGNELEFLKRYHEYYDIIIVDPSSNNGLTKELMHEDIYYALYKALKADGIAITQCESFFYYQKLLKEKFSHIKKVFPVYAYFYTFVPTHPSGIVGFTFCSKKYDPIHDIRVEKVNKFKPMTYYNLELHKAAFILPEGYRELVQ